MQEGLKMSPEEALMQKPTQSPDTCSHILPVAALNLISGAAGNRSSNRAVAPTPAGPAMAGPVFCST